ncbi:unnamed protein product, partial [Closterium sp. Naga37s-1]
CHAQAAVINATQATFLEDCQKAWGKTLPGWARGAYCDEIIGVSCDGAGMITQISLTANLNGSILDSISYLTSLSDLTLTNNNLNGSIPNSISKLSQLTFL